MGYGGERERPGTLNDRLRSLLREHSGRVTAYSEVITSLLTSRRQYVQNAIDEQQMKRD
jgi:hypothetical protein